MALAVRTRYVRRKVVKIEICFSRFLIVGSLLEIALTASIRSKLIA